MSKHHVRDDFEMGCRLDLIRDTMARETGMRPSHGDLLCLAVVRLMDEKNIKYQGAEAETADEWGFESS